MSDGDGTATTRGDDESERTTAATRRHGEAGQLDLHTPEELPDLLATRRYEEWPEDDLAHLRVILVDERKPGLIIDGQHRVAATEHIGGCPFIVSFLPFANWAELRSSSS